MDLNLLQLFITVAEAESFSAAARKLAVQRSSVSRSITTLENQLGVQLFNRSTRSLSLTTAGQAFLSKIAPRLASLGDALMELPERNDEPSGHLSITAPHDFATTVLPAVVGGFAIRYPKVQIEVRVTNRMLDLAAEGVDAALRPSGSSLPDSSLVARRIGRVGVNVYASPSYLSRAGTPSSTDEGVKHSWIQGPFRTLTKAIKPEQGPVISTDDMAFAYECVKDGLGLAFLSDFLVRDDVAAGRLVRVCLQLKPPVTYFYFVHPPVEHYPLKLSAFRDYLIEHVNKNPLFVASELQ